MTLELHTQVSLFKPFRGLRFLFQFNGKYFAVSRMLPWDLDKFMARVSDYKQHEVFGHYVRTWKMKK